MSTLPPSVDTLKIGEGQFSSSILLEAKPGYVDVRDTALAGQKIIYSGDLGDADTWDELQVNNKYQPNT